jgi:hypothetical protein
MARRARSAIKSTPLSDQLPIYFANPSVSHGLRLHAAGERWAALLKQRDRLVADVRKKRAAVETALTQEHSARQALMAQMAPIMLKFEELRGEVAALLNELLAPGRLSARAQKQVTQVRDSLVDQGLIPPRDGADRPFEQQPGDFPFDDPEESDANFEGSPSSRNPRNGTQERVAPAPQHGQKPGRESLRALFRRLVLAVHPDRAQEQGERERRTEAMKEATRAYEDGDLARLLELEKAWQLGMSAPSNANEQGQRCAELEQTLRELRRQLRELRSELRTVRERMREDMLGGPLDELTASAAEELEDFVRIRDFVRDFRDGKITLKQFAKGPGLLDEDAAMLDIDQLIGEFIEEQRRSAPRPRSRAKAKRRR